MRNNYAEDQKLTPKDKNYSYRFSRILKKYCKVGLIFLNNVKCQYGGFVNNLQVVPSTATTNHAHTSRKSSSPPSSSNHEP